MFIVFLCNINHCDDGGRSTEEEEEEEEIKYF
jgi:hypothetical protein